MQFISSIHLCIHKLFASLHHVLLSGTCTRNLRCRQAKCLSKSVDIQDPGGWKGQGRVWGVKYQGHYGLATVQGNKIHHISIIMGSHKPLQFDFYDHTPKVRVSYEVYLYIHLEILKDTCYRLAKISQNQQLLDILACNLANRPSFNKRSHRFLPHCLQMLKVHFIYGALGKKAFCRILKRWFIS